MARIAHLTDIHVRDLASLRAVDLASKRALGLANLQLRRGAEHSVDVLERALDAVIAARPDLCVVSGDLSNLGLASEFAASRRVLQRVANAGVRVAVCPGNHDYYVRSSATGAFEAAYPGWIGGDAGDRETPWPHVYRFDGCAVVLVSSAVVSPMLCAYGELDAGRLARIETVLGELAAERRSVMVAVHHHLGHAPNKRFDALRNLRGSRAFGDLCRKAGVRLIVHGHNHVFSPFRLDDPDGPVVVGLSSSSSTRVDEGHLARVGFYELGDDGVRVAVATRSPANGTFGAPAAVDLASLPCRPA